jgi:hypothetical protein
VFLVVINGSITLEDTRLEKRDAIGIEHTEGFTITAGEESEVLAIEVPMH